MVSPDTTIYFCNVPLTITNDHQLLFESKDTQLHYFLSCVSFTYNNYKYQRKDQSVMVNQNIESLYNINYVVYQNTQYGNKYFYAYITNMEYINDQVTKIYIKTDVFQTWQHDMIINKSFVERQHVADEYNTVADNIATGQLVEVTSMNYPFSGGYFVFCSADPTQDDTTNGSTYDFAVDDYIIPCWVLYWDKTKVNSIKMSQTLQAIANKGRGDRVIGAVYVPFIGNKDNLELNELKDSDIGDITVCQGIKSYKDMYDTLSLDFSNMVGDFKKGLTYPYSKIIVMDESNGQTIELSPEKFLNNKAEFKIQGTISQTPSYKIIPKNYDGQSLAYNHALVTKCNTSLPIANNMYAKYMMENKQQNQLNEIFAGYGMINNAMSGNIAGVVGSFQNICNTVAQENKAAKLTNQVTNISDDAMDRLCFNNTIKIALYQSDSYHQEIQNNYWKMYGYPIHKLSTVNLHSRPDYNYIKLVDPNIYGGSIPGNDMKELISLFEKGITIWHTTEGFRQY